MRIFKDNTTYDNPAMWIDSKNQLWRGPISQDDTMHFARFHGFMDKYHSHLPIWVLESSECPEDCIKVNIPKEGVDR